jgi:hypothetical protein
MKVARRRFIYRYILTGLNETSADILRELSRLSANEK